MEEMLVNTFARCSRRVFLMDMRRKINSSQPDVKTGSLYGMQNVQEILVKPDEWFTQEVIAEGNHIIVLVNGKKTVDHVDQANTYLQGHLALQHNQGFEGKDTVVQFRKIEVKELGHRTPAILSNDWVGLPQHWKIASNEITGITGPNGIELQHVPLHQETDSRFRNAMSGAAARSQGKQRDSNP